MPKWLLYTILSALLWGAWGVVSKIASDSVAFLQMQVLFTIGLVPPVIVAACSKSFRSGNSAHGQRRQGIVFGFATGLVGSVGNMALFAALNQEGKASVVVPLTAVYPLVTVIAAVLLLREKLHWVQGVGIVVALAAVVLLSGETKLLAQPSAFLREIGLSHWMLFALVALGFWGFTGIFQKLSTNHVSAELSFLSFAAAFVPVTAIILATQELAWNLTGAAWFWAILGGVLNGLGSLTSFAAYRSGGKASVVTPLAGLYPVITVFLAILLLGERVGLVELFGIGCAISAAGALSFEGNLTPKVD